MGDLSKLKKYVSGRYGRVYFEDYKSRDIVGMDDEELNLSNGTVMKLKDVSYMLSLRRNIILVSHLAEGGMCTTFTNDTCKVTSGSLVVVYIKKENTL